MEPLLPEVEVFVNKLPPVVPPEVAEFEPNKLPPALGLLEVVPKSDGVTDPLVEAADPKLNVGSGWFDMLEREKEEKINQCRFIFSIGHADC